MRAILYEMAGERYFPGWRNSLIFSFPSTNPLPDYAISQDHTYNRVRDIYYYATCDRFLQKSPTGRVRVAESVRGRICRTDGGSSFKYSPDVSDTVVAIYPLRVQTRSGSVAHMIHVWPTCAFQQAAHDRLLASLSIGNGR